MEVKALIAETENAARGLEFRDEDTIKAKMGELEETNAKVRQNLAKQAAIEDADEYARRYEAKEAELTAVREERISLLSSSQFPLEGLSVVRHGKHVGTQGLARRAQRPVLGGHTPTQRSSTALGGA